jgi:hypothetical protein
VLAESLAVIRDDEKDRAIELPGGPELTETANERLVRGRGPSPGRTRGSVVISGSGASKKTNTRGIRGYGY